MRKTDIRTESSIYVDWEKRPEWTTCFRESLSESSWVWAGLPRKASPRKWGRVGNERRDSTCQAPGARVAKPSRRQALRPGRRVVSRRRRLSSFFLQSWSLDCLHSSELQGFSFWFSFVSVMEPFLLVLSIVTFLPNKGSSSQLYRKKWETALDPEAKFAPHFVRVTPELSPWNCRCPYISPF